MEIKTIMDIAIVKADKLDLLGKDKKGTGGRMGEEIL